MPNHRISAWVLLAVVFPAMYATLARAQSEINSQPNILLLYVDDMGYLPGYTGGTLMKTPHMDALAASGMVFTDGYVAAPICGPSRVGLMTGRYQARTGHDANSRAPGRELLLTETTMAQRMKSLGYKTGVIGKWHLGMTDERFFPTSRGFDYFIGHEGNVTEGSENYYEGLKKIGELDTHPITSEKWATEACAFMESSRNSPFFLYVAFNAVHTPHVAGKEAVDEFASIQNRNLRDYAAMTRELDDAIGRIMEKLKSLGLEENTLVFFISDNGKAFTPGYENDGLRGRKWYVFEGGVRVPFAVSWKGHIAAGSTNTTPVIQLDVLPTAIEAAGARVQSEWELDGVSLLPLLTEQEQTIDRALYWRFGTQFAIREGKWKLVKALASQQRPYLIDLSTDVGEQHDLTDTYPDVARAMLEKWEEWNSTMQAPRWEDKRWDREENARSERE